MMWAGWRFNFSWWVMEQKTGLPPARTMPVIAGHISLNRAGGCPGFFAGVAHRTEIVNSSNATAVRMRVDTPD